MDSSNLDVAILFADCHKKWKKFDDTNAQNSGILVLQHLRYLPGLFFTDLIHFNAWTVRGSRGWDGKILHSAL